MPKRTAGELLLALEDCCEDGTVTFISVGGVVRLHINGREVARGSCAAVALERASGAGEGGTAREGRRMREALPFRTAPLNDGSEEDGQCGRCGSSCYPVDCHRCGGAGGHFGDEMGDLLWYDAEEWYECGDCDGEGGWLVCCSDEAWCEANPMLGRESVKRGVIEWFSIARTPTPPDGGEAGR